MREGPSPSRLIDLYLERRARLTGPPSPLGIMLERARDGMGESSPNQSAQEESRIFFAHLTYCVERVLTALERTVAFAHRTPCGTKEYQRTVRDGDMVLKIVEGGETIQETYHGERFLRSAIDDDGEPIEGYSVVIGLKPVYPTREQVAEQLGIPFADVKRAIRKAYEKLDAMDLEKTIDNRI